MLSGAPNADGSEPLARVVRLGQRPTWQDAIAGMSIAGLLLPEAVAYATIGNLPPQAGVIALFAGLICYGVLGASRFAIVSATSSSAAVLAAATASMAHGDPVVRLMLALALVLVTGGFFLVAAAARLGNLTDLIAKPVMRGFAFGLAVVIILKQLTGMVGLHPPPGEIIWFVPQLLTDMDRWNLPALATGAVALALLFLLGRFQRVPGGLVVIGLGIGAAACWDFPRYGVALAGPIHLMLSAPALPQLASAEWTRVGELGVAMALILYAESYSAIRSLALKHGDRVTPNRDLLALGIANLVSGLLHGMPVGAGYSASVANEAAGAQSRYAGAVAALVLLLIVLTCLPAIALTPQPVLAAIVIYAVSHMLRLEVFRPYFMWKRDRLLIVAAVLGVLLLGVLNGLLAGIGVSLLIMLRQLAKSDVVILGRFGHGHDFVNMARYPDAQAVVGVLILRPEQPLFFANAERILSGARHLIRAAGPATHSVILSLEESSDLDSSSLEALRDFLAYTTSQNKRLLFARLKGPVQEVLQQVFDDASPPPVISGLSVSETVRLAEAAGLESTVL
jgi:MFS superfamily sulfate permease-like transporter